MDIDEHTTVMANPNMPHPAEVATRHRPRRGAQPCGARMYPGTMRVAALVWPLLSMACVVPVDETEAFEVGEAHQAFEVCLELDECGVCEGDGSTCLGCDGVPNSNAELDICGVCGGDGSTCKAPAAGDGIAPTVVVGGVSGYRLSVPAVVVDGPGDSCLTCSLK
jgi:hypothetical protein